MNNSFNDFLDYATSRLDYLDHLNNYIEKSAGTGPALNKILRRTAAERAEAARVALRSATDKAYDTIETRTLGFKPDSKGFTTVSELPPRSKALEDIKYGIDWEVSSLDNGIAALNNVIKTAPDDVKPILRNQLKTYKKLRSDIASGAVPVSDKFAVREGGNGILSKVREKGFVPSGYDDVLEGYARKFDRAVARRPEGSSETAVQLAERKFMNDVARPIYEYAKKNPDPSGTRLLPSKPFDPVTHYKDMHPAYAHYRGLSELHRRAVQSGDRNLANIYKKLMDESEWGRAEAIGNNAITDLLNGKKPTGKPLGEYSDNRLEASIRRDMDENEALFREGLRNKEQYETMKARYQRNLDRVAPSPVGKIEAEIHHLDLLHSKGVIKSKDYKAKRAELDKQLNEAKENAKYDITPEEVRPVPEEVAPAPAPEPTPAPAPTEGIPPTATKPLEPTPAPAPGEAPVPGADPLPVNTKAKPDVPSFNTPAGLQIQYSRQQIAKMQERISEINILIGKYRSGDDVADAVNEMRRLEDLITQHEKIIADLSGGSPLPTPRAGDPAPTPRPVPPTRPTEPIPPTESGVPPTKPTEPVPPTEPGVPPTKTGEPAPTETGVPPTKTGEPVPPTESGVPPTESTPEVKPPFSAGTAAAVLAALGGGSVAAYNFWPSGDGGGDLSEGGSISPQVREIINGVANSDSAELAAARDEIARLRNRPDMSQMSFLERLLFLIFGQHYLDVLGGLTK